MVDYNFDNLMKKCILEVINNKENIPNDEQIWFNLTKCMFRNTSAAEVYGLTEKALEEVSDEQWFEHKYPKGFWNEDWIYPKKKRSVIKFNLKKSRIKKLINENIKITDVAKSYGIEVIKGKALCPFHPDTEASLGFDDKRNIFHCFGCNVKGDIIEFVRRIENNPKKDFLIAAIDMLNLEEEAKNGRIEKRKL